MQYDWTAVQGFSSVVEAGLPLAIVFLVSLWPKVVILDSAPA